MLYGIDNLFAQVQDVDSTQVENVTATEKESKEMGFSFTARCSKSAVKIIRIACFLSKAEEKQKLSIKRCSKEK